MLPSRAQSYSSFGPTDLSNDPEVLRMRQAWRDGQNARNSGIALSFVGIPGSMRQSYKAGYEGRV